MGEYYSIKHSWAGSDKKYTPKEKSRESEYNHEYYMKNKEKWGIKTQNYSENDSDFNDSNYDEKNRIGNSDFFGYKDKDGNWTILEEDMKWKLPKGVELDSNMRKQLESFKGHSDPNIRTSSDWENAVEKILSGGKSNGTEKGFDIDSAAKDVIRGKYKNGAERKAALGSDYDVVQKRVNELMKKSAKHSFDDYSDYLIHHGIQGQKWGVRRYQNEDGSLTETGKKRYATGQKRLDNRIDYYDKKRTKSQYSLSETKRKNAVNLYQRKKEAEKIRDEEDTSLFIGEKTVKQRVGIGISSTLISSGAAAAAVILEEALPLIAIPATLTAAGIAWYKSTR